VRVVLYIAKNMRNSVWVEGDAPIKCFERVMEFNVPHNAPIDRKRLICENKPFFSATAKRLPAQYRGVWSSRNEDL
jgi:hypothetical protein